MTFSTDVSKKIIKPNKLSKMKLQSNFIPFKRSKHEKPDCFFALQMVYVFYTDTAE